MNRLLFSNVLVVREGYGWSLLKKSVDEKQEVCRRQEPLRVSGCIRLIADLNLLELERLLSEIEQQLIKAGPIDKVRLIAGFSLLVLAEELFRGLTVFLFKRTNLRLELINAGLDQFQFIRDGFLEQSRGLLRVFGFKFQEFHCRSPFCLMKGLMSMLV